LPWFGNCAANTDRNGGNQFRRWLITKNLRVNEEIRVPSVRVVDAEGKQLGILAISEAIKEAVKAGLDLVEVAPNSSPPVCRIMDYGKFRYQQSKKLQNSRKHSAGPQLKEIRLRPKTEEHDLQVKLKHIRKFIEQKDKVKITIMFRGREIVYSDMGRAMMEEIRSELEGISIVDQTPKLEGRNMVMILSPKK